MKKELLNRSSFSVPFFKLIVVGTVVLFSVVSTHAAVKEVRGYMKLEHNHTYKNTKFVFKEDYSTLDLNGSTLNFTTLYNDGILADKPYRNICIKNGTIKGNVNHAIRVWGESDEYSHGVYIKNMNIRANYNGIYFKYVENSTIRNCQVLNAGSVGIHLKNCNYPEVYDCPYIYGAVYGIAVLPDGNTQNPIIQNSNIHSDAYAIYLNRCSNSLVSNCNTLYGVYGVHNTAGGGNTYSNVTFTRQHVRSLNIEYSSSCKVENCEAVGWTDSYGQPQTWGGFVFWNISCGDIHDNDAENFQIGYHDCASGTGSTCLINKAEGPLGGNTAYNCLLKYDWEWDDGSTCSNCSW